MGDYFSLGLNIMLAVFLGFGLIWGFIRGFKKSLSRNIFLLITSLLLILLVIPISNALLNIPFNVTITGNQEIVFTGKYTIAQVIEHYIEQFLGEDVILNNPNIAKNLVKIPVIFINAIVYLLLFWLFKYLLLPINALITKLFNKKPQVQMGFANMGENDNSPEEKTGTFITNTERISEEEKVNKNELVYQEEPVKKEKEPNREDVLKAHAVADKRLKELQNKKKVLKQEKKRQKKELNKKSFPNRLLGSLIGVATGLIITFNTMIPIYGFMSILNNANKLKLEHLTEDEISLSNLTNGATDDILNSYDKSIMNFLSKYSGMQAVGNKSFDLITTQNIDGKKVVLREEIEAVVTSVQNVDTLIGKYKSFTKEGFENLTQAQLDDLLINTHNVLNACKDVQIINIVADYALPMICSYMIKNEIRFSDNALVNEMLVEVLTEIINASGISITEELDKILDIADYVNEQRILLPVLQQNYNDIIALCKIPEDDFGKTLVSKILNLKVVDVTLTNFFTYGIEIFDDMTNMDINNGEVTKETLSTAMTNLFNDAFLLSKTLDSTSPVYLTLNSLIPTGRLLDTAKNSGIVTNDTYTKMIDWAMGKVRAVTNAALPIEFVDVVNNEILSNTTKVNNWTMEMTSIRNAIDILRDYENGIIGEKGNINELREGLSIHFEITENKINNLGKFLDAIEKTVLFGTTTNAQINNEGEYYKATPMTKLVTSICDYAITTLKDTLEEDSSMLEIADVLTTAKNNMTMASHRSFSTSTFFETEFSNISPLIVEMHNLIDSESFEITNKLGKALDYAKHSVMFGNDTTAQLISTTLNIVKDEVLGKNYEENTTDPTINDKIYKLITATQNNLQDEELITTMLETSNFWEQEIDILKELQDLSNDVKNLNDINDISPLAPSLDKVFKNNISGEKVHLIPLENLKELIAFSVRDIKTEESLGVDGQINSILENIATNIENETFADTGKVYLDYWQIEFSHLTTLSNIEFNDIPDDTTTPENEEYKVLDNLDKIGFELDKVTLGYTINQDDTIKLGIDNTGKSTTRASYLITHNMIRNLTSAGIDEMSTTISAGFTDATISSAITTALNSISANIKNTTSIPTISFTDEFTHLNALADLSEISIDSSIFTSSSTEDLNKLNTLGSTLDSIAFNVKNSSDTYSYNDTINSKIITRLILNSLIADITPMAKGSNDIINSTVDTLTNRIDSLNTDTLLSWEHELNKVHDLVALNETSITSLDSTEDEAKLKILGVNIDAIAFNTDIVITEGIVTTNPTQFYDGYKYYSTDKYNSIIITREILKTTVASFISSAKPANTEALEDEILADLIDNTTAYINTSNDVNKANTYLNFSASFEDLIATKNDIEEIESEFETVNLESLSSERAKSVDLFLSTEQSRLICGVQTTRKVTILILTNLQSSMIGKSAVFNTTEPGKYLTGLISYYNSRITANSTDLEAYSSGTDYNMTTDGNTLASDYSNINTSNPIETIRVSWLNYLNSLT